MSKAIDRRLIRPNIGWLLFNRSSLSAFCKNRADMRNFQSRELQFWAIYNETTNRKALFKQQIDSFGSTIISTASNQQNWLFVGNHTQGRPLRPFSREETVESQLTAWRIISEETVERCILPQSSVKRKRRHHSYTTKWTMFRKCRW